MSKSDKYVVLNDNLLVQLIAKGEQTVSGIYVGEPEGVEKYIRAGTVLKTGPGKLSADGLTIVSPSVGVFLHRHPMHAAPLAPPGAHVRPGDTLALLQIGVLLVPVLAPRAGIVAGTWTAHGSVVGFGARLIQLHTLPGISAP